MLREYLVQIVFGWPAIITSLLVSLTGLLSRKPILILIGGVIVIPFCWYLSGYPTIRSAAFLLPIFQFTAGFAIAKKKIYLAWFLFMPLAIVVFLMAIAVLSQ